MRGKQKLSQSDYILRCTRYFHNDAKWRQQSSTVENERCSINTSIRFLGTDVANFTRFGWFRPSSGSKIVPGDSIDVGI